MKNTGIVYAAMLSAMLIGTASMGYAQQNNQHGKQGEQDKHPQAQGGGQVGHQPNSNGNRQPSQGQPQSKQAQRPSPDNHVQAQHVQQRPSPSHPAQAEHVQQRPQAVAPREQRASNFDKQHQTWEQRGGYTGYRIPNDRFSQSFGSGHSFHMSGLPFMEFGGRPRFQYDGYWLSLMEPYPEYWGPSWDRNDDMYVEFSDGGYYLYDRRFPGRPGVTLSISL